MNSNNFGKILDLSIYQAKKKAEEMFDSSRILERKESKEELTWIFLKHNITLYNEGENCNE